MNSWTPILTKASSTLDVLTDVYTLALDAQLAFSDTMQLQIGTSSDALSLTSILNKGLCQVVLPRLLPLDAAFTLNLQPHQFEEALEERFNFCRDYVHKTCKKSRQNIKECKLSVAI